MSYDCDALGCPRTAATTADADAEGWASEFLDSCGVTYYWCPDHVAERQAHVDAHGQGDEDGPP